MASSAAATRRSARLASIPRSTVSAPAPGGKKRGLQPADTADQDKSRQSRRLNSAHEATARKPPARGKKRALSPGPLADEQSSHAKRARDLGLTELELDAVDGLMKMSGSKIEFNPDEWVTIDSAQSPAAGPADIEKEDNKKEANKKGPNKKDIAKDPINDPIINEPAIKGPAINDPVNDPVIAGPSINDAVSNNSDGNESDSDDGVNNDPASINPVGNSSAAQNAVQNAVQNASSTGWVGISTGRGTSANKPPSSIHRSHQLLDSPWHCAEKECATGFTWVERDGPNGVGRKMISQYFGRNKKQTNNIHPAVWHVYCRKHYQRTKYYADRLDKADFVHWVVQNLRVQIHRLQIWRPNATFSVQLNKAMTDRMAHWDKCMQTANNRINNARLLFHVKYPTTGKNGKEVVSSESQFPRRLADDFITSHASTKADFDDMKAVLDWTLQKVDAGDLVSMPPMEFLIDAEGEDEACVTDPDTNYDQWLAASTEEDEKTEEDNDDEQEDVNDAREAEGAASEAEGAASEAEGAASEAEGAASEAEEAASEAEGAANEAEGAANEAEGAANEAEGAASEAEGDAGEDNYDGGEDNHDGGEDNYDGEEYDGEEYDGGEYDGGEYDDDGGEYDDQANNAYGYSGPSWSYYGTYDGNGGDGEDDED